MLNRFICWSFVLSLAGSLSTAALANETGAQDVRSEALRAHVEFLADDLLEGRAASSRGFEIAARYVAAQFRQYGLKPGAREDSWYQEVPLLEATPVLPGSAAELAIDEDNVIEFEYSTDYLPAADFTASNSEVSAQLAFVGFGVEAPEFDYNDFEHVDLEGRIAVILSGAPARLPHHARAYHSWSVRKFSKLVEHGALGVITIDSPDDAQRFPWERSVSLSWVPQMRWLDESGEPADAFPELKLRFRFNTESGARLFENTEHSYAEILEKAAQGVSQGFELAGTMRLAATTGLRRTTSSNVVGLLEGSDPRLKSEYVVITAHLDHLGKGAPVGGDTIYNGAHDNALGIAMLLETARAMSAGPRPRRSVLFVAVTAEERGLLGSDYFAAQGIDDGDIVANLNLDMPLIFAPTRDFVALGEQHSSLGPIVARAASALGYRLSPDPAPEEVGFIRSDQLSFIRRGIPALTLRGGTQPRDPSVDLAELTRTFRQEHYHQPSDELSLPMDFPTAADLARISRRVATEAANAPNRPAWKRGDFFGTTFESGSTGR